MFNDETKVVSTESFDPLTDTGKVAKAVQQVREQIKKDFEQSNARLVVEIDNLLKEREKVSRSFWRAVFNAIRSGAEQSFAELKRIIKE